MPRYTLVKNGTSVWQAREESARGTCLEMQRCVSQLEGECSSAQADLGQSELELNAAEATNALLEEELEVRQRGLEELGREKQRLEGEAQAASRRVDELAGQVRSKPPGPCTAGWRRVQALVCWAEAGGQNPHNLQAPHADPGGMHSWGIGAGVVRVR